MKKNFKIFTATMMALVMTIAMTACGTEPSTSREDTTTVTTTESSVKEETVTQEPVVEEPVAQETETEEPSTEAPAPTGPVEFTFASVGAMYFDEDIMAACQDVGYDYLFEDVKEYIETADVAMGTIQVPLDGFYNLDIGESIKNAGFDAINVATVDCYSEGSEGLNHTISGVHLNDMIAFGAKTNANPYDKIGYVDVNGVKVAFISGTQGVTVSEDTVDVNSIDEDVLIAQIDEAKSNGAGVIIVSLNYFGGEEKTGKDLATNLAAAGADIVIASGIGTPTFVTSTLFDGDGNAIGKYYESQGSFITTSMNVTMVTTFKVVIDENGNIDSFNMERERLPIYIDSNDHYKLVPLSEDDLNGDWPEDVKEFIKICL